MRVYCGANLGDNVSLLLTRYAGGDNAGKYELTEYNPYEPVTDSEGVQSRSSSCLLGADYAHAVTEYIVRLTYLLVRLGGK